MVPRPLRGPSRRSAAIVTGRLVLVAIAAAAAVFGFLGTQRAPTAANQAAAAYTCPMHPEVRAAGPGQCPICHMDLVPRSPGAHADGHDHGHAHAHGRGPAAAPAADGEPDSLTLPEGVEVHGFDTMSRAHRTELSLEMRAPAWADGARSGAALYHLDEAELIQPGDAGLFSPSAGPLPGHPLGVPVRITDAKPEPWDRSTVLVRFEVEPGIELARGAAGFVKLPPRVRRDLLVAASAIVQGPEGPYVLAIGDDRRTLTKRPVRVGTVNFESAAVVSGLHEGEYVLAKHVFVLDSERRLVRRSTP